MKWVILPITIVALAILACAAAQAAVPAPGQGYLYVGNGDDNTISIVDLQTGSVLNTIDVTGQVTGMAADPTGYYVYYDCSDGVHIIDTKTDETRNAGLPVAPHAISVAPDGSGYYVLYNTYIDLVRIGSGDVVQKITLPRSKDIMAISPDGKMACLASAYFDTSGLYKMPSGESASPEIDFGKSVACTFSPDTQFAYVSLAGQKKVIALKVYDYFIKYDINLDSDPGGLAASPDGSTLYITEPSANKVVAVNISSRNVVGTIDVGSSPQNIIFSSDGTRAYVTSAGSNFISVIDTSGLPGSIGSVTKNIPVGDHPVYLTIASKPALPTDTPTPTPVPTPTPTPTATPTATTTPTIAPTPTATPVPTPTAKPSPGLDSLIVLACFSLTCACLAKK